jgi:drug/metabolite transporter (DMT)-like permease
MQLWLPLALLAPLLFAGCVFVDKYLIEKITEDSPAVVITILAGLAGLPFLIGFGFIARHDILGFGFVNALGAISAGLLVLAGYYFYYRALETADASLVATLFQFIVVFNYVLGLVFLDEHLKSIQLVAIGMVVFGSIVLTLESHQKKIRLNKSMLCQMLIATLLIAVSDVVFKLVAKKTAYLPTQFYEYSSGVIVGTLLLLFHGSARGTFLAMMRKFKKLAIGASTFNEILNLGAIVSMRYAMFLAPIAVVQAVMSTQSVYLLILGIALTLMFPKYIRENISKKHLIQKITAVLIMVGGTAILSLYS